MQRIIKCCLLAICIQSCSKDEVITNNASANPVANTNLTATLNNNGLIINRYTCTLSYKDYPLYDPTNTGGISGGIDQATNGTLFYTFQNVDHIIINPNKNGGNYTSPIHFVNTNNDWKLESGDYGKLMDMPRNTSKISDGVYSWANASVENNITGNVYISKTGVSNEITWKKISLKDGYYETVTTGDIDNDGTTEILTFKGAELGRPELFEVYSSSGELFSQTNIMPSLQEFEAATNAKDFSFGSMIVANIDPEHDGNELILTSTRNVMNSYFSFIVLNFNKKVNKFEIIKIIKPDGALKEFKLAVADIKSGNFNDDNYLDLVVSMGQGVDDKSGIQVWYSDGKGGLTPGKNKIFTSSDLVHFTNFEVGKYGNNKFDNIFLHYKSDNPTNSTNSIGLDLNKFYLINDGLKESPFTNPTNLILPFSVMTLDKTTGKYMIPPFVKGYFHNNKLRLIGFRGRLGMYGNNNSDFKGYNEFDFYDMTF